MNLDPIMRMLGIMFVSIALLSIFSITGYMDLKDEIIEVKNYCSMVTIWEDDKANGVKVLDRNGYPPYDDSIDCSTIKDN